MTNQTLDQMQLLRLCCGNTEAVQWLSIGHAYIHEIDDLIDEDIPRKSPGTVERIGRIGMLALQLYTHPFFLRYSGALSAAMITNCNLYMDSVRWEKSDVPWQRNFSAWARHGWVDVALLVGFLCAQPGRDPSAFAHLRREAKEIRHSSQHDHAGDNV